MIRPAYETEYKRRFGCNPPPEGYADVLWKIWKVAWVQAASNQAHEDEYEKPIKEQ